MHAREERDFGWLWSAYAVSTSGTWLAFGAFPLLAVRVLGSSVFAVALLSAAGLAVAALVAFGLGPWVEHRNKRPVLIATDLIRFGALASVPVAYVLGVLSYGQLLVVSVVSGTAGLAYAAASGAYLKHLVHADALLVANGRFEGTNWVATAVGPPLGGALIGMFGPIVTVTADAVSFLVSACCLARLRGGDVATPVGAPGAGPAAGWHHIRDDRVLLRLFLNSILVSGLIMATVPLLSVLLLGEYRFPAWQYGLAFGLPAVGGLLGARLSAPLVRRYGEYRVLRISGWSRALCPLGLACVQPGIPGLLIVIGVEGLLIMGMGVFNPVHATIRLRRTSRDHAARVLSTWNAGGKLLQATLTVGWGLLATWTGPLTAITIAGALLLATPLLLPCADDYRTKLPSARNPQISTPKTPSSGATNRT